MAGSAQSFFWYDLITTDLEAAERFYGAVVGWTGQRFGGGDNPYVVLNAGDRGVGGMMVPIGEGEQAAQPRWVGYVYAADVDEASARVRAAGGLVHRPSTDIADVGRFAVVADPQGAPFMLMSPMGPDMPPVSPMTPGHVAWHELYATDWEQSFGFYSELFGWSKTEAMDMGPMGTYQLFGTGGDAIGGMMNKPPQIAHAAWLFYFFVPDIDQAESRVRESGGQVLMGPDEVPGGGWILQCLDPQGAWFALTGPKGTI